MKSSPVLAATDIVLYTKLLPSQLSKFLLFDCFLNFLIILQKTTLPYILGSIQKTGCTVKSGLRAGKLYLANLVV